MNNINENSRCAVIGYGSWATAIAKILLESSNELGWYVRNEIVRDGIRDHKVNPKYLTEVHFKDDSKINLYDDINAIVRDHDILIVAVPSAFLSSTLANLTESLENKMIISAIKGIVRDSDDNFITITEYFNQVWGVKYSNLGVVTGPCHAEEVALERLTYINIICKDIKMAEMISHRFSCKYIITHALTDIYGAEYSAVLKNIYAMAVGICKGLGYGDNFIAVLITNASAEIKEYLDESYPFDRELNSSAYFGDLLVTSYSQFSRNRSFGMMIGQGYSISAARIELNDMIAEGYYAAMCIHNISKNKNLNLPIAEAVYTILYTKSSAVNVIKQLTKKLK